MDLIVGPLFVLGIAALIPAQLARGKGRDPLLWWLFGLLFLVPALVVVLLVSDLTQTDEALVAAGQRRRCPHCAEAVRLEAAVCPHCQRDIPAEADATASGEEPMGDLHTEVLRTVVRPRAVMPTTERVAADVNVDVAAAETILHDLERAGYIRAHHPTVGRRNTTYWRPA